MVDKNLERVRTLIARVVSLDRETDATNLAGVERERATAAVLACRIIDEHHLLDQHSAPTQTQSQWEPAPPPPWARPGANPWANQPPPSDTYYPPPRPPPPPADAWSPSPPKQYDVMDDVMGAIRDAFNPKPREPRAKPKTTPGKHKITTAKRSGKCKGCDDKYVAGDKIVHKDGYGTVIAGHVSCVMGLEAWS